MSRWEDLHDRARALEVERQRQEDETRALARARTEIDEWAERALGRIWVELLAVLERRVGDFSRGSGVEVRIAERQHTRWAGANRTRMFAVETPSVTAYLYSHQVSGFSPTFHLVEWPTSGAGRRQRHKMVTLSLARVEREGIDGHRLMKPNLAVGPVDYDDIAYRVLELVVAGMRRAVAPRLPSFVEAVTAPALSVGAH
jgi:hypothetical protein